MTAKARQLGMVGTVFRNASGLPDPDQHTTARDMAVLGMALQAALPAASTPISRPAISSSAAELVRGHNDMLGARARRRRHQDRLHPGLRLQHRHLGQRRRPQADGRGDGRESARKARNAQVEALIDRYLPSASRVGGGTLLAAF